MTQKSRPQNEIEVLNAMVQAEVDGIEMGVLEDGTPYLSARGLARMCDVAPSAVIEQGQTWKAGGRTNKLAQVILSAGYSDDLLYIPTKTADGRLVHAHTDVVCMAFLQYYGFVATPLSQEAARRHNMLALQTFRKVIYKSVGFDPDAGMPRSWQHVADRLKLHELPDGYFSVFRESVDIAIAANKGGLQVDHHTIPDISIGKAWGEHWTENELEKKYGPRVHHPHNYPAYYPQAQSNPQEIWVYPWRALGDFKTWLHHVYLPEKFPSYLGTLAKKGAITDAKAKLLLTELKPKKVA